MNWLVDAWYNNARWLTVFSPLASLYQIIANKRKQKFLTGERSSFKAPVPVIVVGNITVGGTGKTPFTIELVTLLQAQGLHPGVVSRGYGGKAKHYPINVTAQSMADVAGDEPVLIWEKTHCPVVVDPNRVDAVKTLLASYPKTNVIISDDGLQHYALQRDIEIALVDQRGFGNQHCLPQGPLREPMSRLSSVDFVVLNGQQGVDVVHQYKPYLMTILPTQCVNLMTNESINVQDPEFKTKFGAKQLQALCGIGNPQRFLHTLKNIGLDVVPHVFPDHHHYKKADLQFSLDKPVIMTAKDAVKCRSLLDEAQTNYWYLDIQAKIDEQLQMQILHQLKSIKYV